jgi:hypothetical protein
VSCEDPAVAAKAREQRATYVTAGLGCLGLGAAIVWSLGALNNQAGRRVRQRAALEEMSAEDWEYKGPLPSPTEQIT